MLKFLTRLSLAYPARVAIIGTLLAMVGAYFSVLLYAGLRTDIEELLPQSARSVRDLDRLAERLESFDNIVLLTFSKDKAASRRFVDDLAQRLATVPKSTIARVEYRIQDEVKFFKQRQGLYLDPPDLVQLHEYIKQRIAYEKQSDPFQLFPSDDKPKLVEPKLDIAKLKDGNDKELEVFTRLPDGYYATSNEKVRAVVIYMPGKGLKNAHRMKAAIASAVTALNPRAYAADLDVKYTGNVENLIEESAALVADLEFSTVVVILLVSAAIAIFYRSIWATTALVISLFMGTLWTFGLAYFLVGYLNANSAFLASIVIGNGINFGIIMLARYLEERRHGHAARPAVELAIMKSGGATATAAAAAALSYGSLMLTSFRGFSQFGTIGLVGMALCWLSAYTLLPAYLLLIDRWVSREVAPRAGKAKLELPMMTWLAQGVARFAKPICAVAVVASVLSVIAFKNYGPDIIETDFSKLRDINCMTHGSGAYYHYIHEIFGHSSSPLIVLPTSREQTETISQALLAKKKEQGANSPIATVQTLEDFVPKGQPEKIVELVKIKKLFTAEVMQQIPRKQRKRVDEALGPAAFRTFVENDLPPSILEKFRENDGTTGKLVMVDKRFDAARDDSRALTEFIVPIREVVDRIAPGLPVAGELAVTYDMFQAIVHDGPKVTLCAFLLVTLLVCALFRNARTIGLAVFALGLGVLWFVGILLGFRLKLNFLNFIALPITFGIGVDYGVNVFQRYREQGSRSILDVIRNTGGAVVLCSLTTIIGYSSLLMAGNRAFVSFGLLAVLGEITCVSAAVIALPAFLTMRSEKTATRKRVPDTSAPKSTHGTNQASVSTPPA